MDNPLNFVDWEGSRRKPNANADVYDDMTIGNLVKTVSEGVAVAKSTLMFPISVGKAAGASVVALANGVSTEKIQEDWENFDFYNTNEEKAYSGNVFSFYKGTPVINQDIPIFDASFQLGNTIMLKNGQGNLETIRHEWGHWAHESLIGFDNYLFKVALPSVATHIFDIQTDDYYSWPWEHIAEVLGKVDRKDHTYLEDTLLKALWYGVFTACL